MTVSQSQFRAALLNPDHLIPAGLCDSADRPAGARFNVYRNNVAVSLTEAMHTAFPVISKLLGPENMDGLAGIFLRRHPPTSPLMMFYGAEFPDFLASNEQLAHLGYLPDIARLDLALRHSYHAADAAPIQPERLAETDPEELMASTIQFAPTLRVLRSIWPIHDIWRFNTIDTAPNPHPGPQDVAVMRPEFDPKPYLLPPGGADWIAALRDGKTIGVAHEIAMSNSIDFDLGATLGLLLQGGAVISLTSKE